LHGTSAIAIVLLSAAYAAVADPPTPGTGSAPALTITAGAERVVVSFRAQSDWVLEFSDDLEHWSTQARGKAGRQAVTVPAIRASGFFQLRLGASRHPTDDDHKKHGKGKGKWKKH